MSPTARSSIQSFLQSIIDEKIGFSFGKPDRTSEESLACILPILRKTTLKRQYVTLPETEHVVITDSGMINKVNIKNTGKENLFLRSSTIFDGKAGTQTRALTRSAIVFPGDEVGLDVRCIHASHGIHTGTKFSYGGTVPLSVETSSYSSGYTPRDQHTVWNAVAQHTTTSASMRGMTPSHIPNRAQVRSFESFSSRALFVSPLNKTVVGDQLAEFELP